MKEIKRMPLTASHWGVYRAEVENGELRALHPFERDPTPSPIAQGYLGVLNNPLRITSPMVRKSYLEHGPGSHNSKRGNEPFVPVSWEVAEELVAAELNRVKNAYGNEAIYGGSYGWSSAGRFHHAQSQLHRFLNCIGGYTKSVNSYSLAAGEVILSHILGNPAELIHNPPSWDTVANQTDILVAFGGLPLRNSQISSGGTGAHRAETALKLAKKRGMKFVNISPIRTDICDEFKAEWIAPRPGSDVAIMLAIAHELIINSWYSQTFLDRLTVGFDELKRYILGLNDGVAKDIHWASSLSDVSPELIRDLAERLAHSSRPLLSISWSLTRQEHGEQTFWMGTALAAMLGHIGKPGGGIAFGFCASNSVGVERKKMKFASLPQGSNPVKSFIPVARISDMLLNPGGRFTFNGETHLYPDIKMIYWAGGNPFHHHQDLSRLITAWQKPDTVVVHEWCWNALAKRADIVLPCTNQLERRDIMMTPRDPYIISMEAVVKAPEEARDDYHILTNLSRKMGVEDEFTAGKSADKWLKWLYEESRKIAKSNGVSLPHYNDFLAKGWHFVEPNLPNSGALSDFRCNPKKSPLNTPSGRIEVYSETLSSFENCELLAHPAWYEPKEWLGDDNAQSLYHLISHQPSDKLHSQLDHGPLSHTNKKEGRAMIKLNPVDAKQKQIRDNDTVRVFNRRGACLAYANIDDAVRPGVVAMSTGAWLDAIDQKDGSLLCRSGNPNTLTQDIGTSSLAQGPTAMSCLVDVEKYLGNDHDVQAYRPPEIDSSDIL